MTHNELLEKYKDLFSKDFFSERGEHRFFSSRLPIGWIPLVDKLLSRIKSLGSGCVYINVIKEKFGSLRVYLNHEDSLSDPNKTLIGEDNKNHIDGLIDMAELFSKTICQECGSSNAQLYKNNNWLMTLCPSHTNSNCTKYKLETF